MRLLLSHMLVHRSADPLPLLSTSETNRCCIALAIGQLPSSGFIAALALIKSIRTNCAFICQIGYLAVSSFHLVISELSIVRHIMADLDSFTFFLPTV